MKTLAANARIGIINRGEAAYRFVRAVKEYNLLNNTQLKTAAFYMDKEAEALFAAEADFSYPLSGFSHFASLKGPAYLDYELLIQALLESGCQGVWAGWGFVSEDAAFVRKVEEAGLVFLGPSAAVIDLVGDKISSKELAEKSGTPICPWSGGPVPTLDAAYKTAEKIGYPCVVKASNAGGGRGIRFVFKKEEMAAQYQSAVEETLRITGNDLVFMERLVEKGRHLEVQALADTHGAIKTFGVRDCSAQRKNQKIIEETPPAGLDGATLQAIQKAAKGLLAEAGYTGAGTVEFLYDLVRKEFYFMEVNARLQVEHPITEQLFSIDLVGGQIDVAMGKSIAHYNETPNGWVMEARLNAEDPENNFRPAGGKVLQFRPAGGIGVRIDSGIQKGSVIPPDFDSMAAKIIASAPTREAAVARLRRALDETKIKIEGGASNRTFVLDLLSLPEIQKGGISTRFVEEYLAARKERAEQACLALLAAAAEIYLAREAQEFEHFRQEMHSAGLARNLKAAEGQEIALQYAKAAYTLYTRRLSQKLFCVETDGKSYGFEYVQGPQSSLFFNGQKHSVMFSEQGDALRVEVNNRPYLIESDSGGVIKAPSPGLALSVKAKAGQNVKQGQTLLVLEAMKMELPVSAPQDATIGDILVKAGEQVAAGQSLIRLEKNEESGPKKQGKAEAFANVKDSGPHAACEVLALFQGYDGRAEAFDRLSEKEKSETAFQAVASFNAIAKLFSSQRLAMKGYAQNASYAEHLAAYYKTFQPKEEDFPEPFNAALARAMQLYGPQTESQEEAKKLVFRFYRANASRKSQEKALASLLSFLDAPQTETAGAKLPPAVKRQERAEALDQLAELSPTLATAAAETRYRLFDKAAMAKLSAKREIKFERLIGMLRERKAMRDQLMARAVSYGSQSEAVLARNIFEQKDVALNLEILIRRMYRDCPIASLQIEAEAGFASIEYTDHEGTAKRACLAAHKSLARALAAAQNQKGALLLAISEEEASLAQLAGKAPGFSYVCCAALNGGRLAYQNFVRHGSQWLEDSQRAFFSPLSYRELRVYRLKNFKSSYTRIADNIVLAAASALENPKDERFFLFVNVETAQIELDSQGALVRLVGFEELFAEGVAALRAEQGRRKRALYWNRIVIYIRPQLLAEQNKIEAYARSVVYKYITPELGLERACIYLRGGLERACKSQEPYQELTITQLQGRAVKIETRCPVSTLLRKQDDYESKVTRARARNMFYPYELIAMLADSAMGLPSTSFEEYDLAEGGQTAYQSVKGRPYGQNQANLIFGLVETKLNGVNCKRVIILSDPTGDMGSLAEAECRRVNAALDLADDLGLPVEWLPVSSGARIEMESGTENLDWTAATLKRIIEFTQNGGEINLIVASINVGAQSYWNSEASMLMHCRGLLIMTAGGSMLLTGKKALDFAGSVSAETNLEIGGAERIMAPNGEAQIYVNDIKEAFETLFHYYCSSYALRGQAPARFKSRDEAQRNIAESAYADDLNQGFKTIGDIFSAKLNSERKKPFDIRQVMRAVCDNDFEPLERWQTMRDAETAVVWQARIGGYACGLLGIESQPLTRREAAPYDGPQSYAGGTLYPASSKKLARGINACSGRMPLIVLANLSGFDGSPESLRKRQLEYGAEIGRAIVNFKGPILFTVIGRYHGGAYVVFSKALNPQLKTYALEGAYASVIGGAPAAAAVFPGQAVKAAYQDERVVKALAKMEKAGGAAARLRYEELFKEVLTEKQAELAKKFDQIHSVERAKRVGSIDEIIPPSALRPKIIEFIEKNSPQKG